MGELHIGERVRYWRARRGKNQRILAGLAGISQPFLSQIETGARGVESRATLVALAEALEVSVAELTGRPGDPTDPARAVATASVPAIREAMIMRTAGEVGPANGVTVAEAVAAVTAADYAGAASMLPSLLRSTSGVDLVQASYAAMSLLAHIGYADLGREAAGLALATAEDLDDPTWLAVGRWVRARALPPETATLAVELARQAAVDVQPHLADPQARQVYGMLHLIAALRCAIVGRVGDAMSHLDEAAVEARTLGDPADAGLCRLGFGPTNVAIWNTVVLAEIGDPERAAAVASKVQPGRLAIPHRQAMFWLDHGKTLTTLGRDGEAVAAFLRAEAIAPQLARLLPTVQSTISVIWLRTRRASVSPQLRRAAEMVGIRDR
jgi:transcriptional regulator with XRE-family HTH domain